MPSNKEIKDREDFMLAGKLSELDWVPKSEAEIAKDLFKGIDPEKQIDAFEKQLGISLPDAPAGKQIYKCVDLRPFDDSDRELLQKFYNNPEKYQVIHRSDNWTHRGDLVIFLEYFENMDACTDKEDKE